MRYSLSLLGLIAVVGVSEAQPSAPSAPPPPAASPPVAPSATAPPDPAAAAPTDPTDDAPADPAAAAPTDDDAPTAPTAPADATPAPPRPRAPYGKGPTATKPRARYTPPPPKAKRPPSEYDDPHATSLFLAPTAIMPPAGSRAFHSYELVLTGFSYSPSATTSLSFTSFLPGVPFGFLTGLFSIKKQIVRNDWLRIALAGAAFGANEDPDADYFATAGAVATACFDCACASHATAYVAVPMSSSDELDPTVPVIYSGGIVLSVGGDLKLLAELDGGGLFGSEAGDHSILGIAGIRIVGNHVGFDLGMMFELNGDPFGNGEDDETELLPLLNISYRY